MAPQVVTGVMLVALEQRSFARTGVYETQILNPRLLVGVLVVHQVVKTRK